MTNQATAPLLDAWVERPVDDKGLYVLEGKEFVFLPYSRLAADIDNFSAELERRVDAGSCIGIAMPQPEVFFVAFLAVIRAGATAVPIPPPAPFQSPQDYAARIQPILDEAGVNVVIASEEGLPFLQASLDGVSFTSVSTAGGSIMIRRRPHARVALLQYTSGSTSSPRGARVTPRNLSSNIAAIHQWLSLRDTDRVVTWLPTFHDMGLIGALLAPASMQVDIFAMKPEDFIRRPSVWAEVISNWGATATLAPPFGYRLLQRRIRQAGDLSQWRIAICGGEPIDPLLLRDFAQHFRSAGFQASSFCPAYGMAEATLAVSGVPPGVRPRSALVKSSDLRLGSDVRICSQTYFDEISTDDVSVNEGTSAVISCGSPLLGAKVEIRHENRSLCSEGVLGEIWVAGSNVAAGYLETDDDAFVDGWFRTGDVGFLLDSELYVLGRLTDRIKLRGKWIYAEDLERRVGKLTGLAAHRILAVPSLLGQRVGVIILLETRSGSPGRGSTDEVARAAELLIGSHVPVQVKGVSRIPRTTSGKPRRRHAWEELNEGRLT